LRLQEARLWLMVFRDPIGVRSPPGGPCGRFGTRSLRQTCRCCVGEAWNWMAIPALGRLAPALLAVLHIHRGSHMAH